MFWICLSIKNYHYPAQALKSALDAGEDLGMPDGVLINGKGPFRYNTTLVPDGIGYESVNVEPGRNQFFKQAVFSATWCINYFQVQILQC